MKKLLLSLLITASFLAHIEDTHGQLKEIEKFLDAGGDNVEALTKAYLSPLPNGVITGLNSGWTTKAKPTKSLGFSLQLRASLLLFLPLNRCLMPTQLALKALALAQVNQAL